MKQTVWLLAAALVLTACPSTPPAAPSPSPSNPTPDPAPAPISVTGAWSGDLTPDDGSAMQSISLQLVDGQDGAYGGYATPYGQDTPHYPLSGNTRTGQMTIQFVFGSTINLSGQFNHLFYKGTYTTSTGQKGSFDISRNIR